MVRAAKNAMKEGARKVLLSLAVVAVTLVMSLAVTEVLLRLFPSMIGINVLERFHPELRTAISQRLGLTTNSDKLLIRSEERSDGGPNLYIYKPDTTYSMPPSETDKSYGAVSSIRTDHHGFCNEPGKPSGERLDILSIGGSIPNCVGVPAEEIFSAVLENSTGYSVYNLGANGTGPYEYLELLRQFGLAFKPRVVIMNISEGNDLRDIIYYNDYLDGRGKRFIQKQPMGGLFAVSYAAAFLKSGVKIKVKQMKRMSGRNFRFTVSVDGETVVMNTANTDRDEAESAQRLSRGELGPELYEPVIAAFAKLAKEEGFVPVISYIPGYYTVYDATIDYEDNSIADDMRRYSRAQRAWFEQNANDHDIAFIDTTPGLQAAAETRPLLYFPSALHMTREGHRVLANIMSSAMETLAGGR